MYNNLEFHFSYNTCLEYQCGVKYSDEHNSHWLFIAIQGDTKRNIITRYVGYLSKNSHN